MFPPDFNMDEQRVRKKFNLGTINTEETKAPKHLLEENIHLFTDNMNNLGVCTVLQHKIHTGDAISIKQKLYRPGPVKNKFIKEEIDRLLKAGLIRPSISPWSSPVVIVAKKGGKMRFCVDYRKLNKVTKLDAYPLPLIKDIFDVLGGSRFFTTLDAASGYWQIEMHPDSIEKTSFTTNWGNYEYLVMPFGLTNAPATYQRAMDIILRDLIREKVMDFVDDTCIYTRTTFKQHLDDLQEVFNKFDKADLKLNVEKCFFAYKETKLLRHIVRESGLKTDSEKVEKLNNMRIPKDITVLRAFLGLAGYYRRFIQGFSVRAKAIFQLLKKNIKWEWKDEQNTAFEDMKKQLTTAPVLAFPDLTIPFILTTDASYQGLGAMLSQIGKDNEERAISYSSSTLKPTQENYSVTQLEALAVIWAIEKYKHYLWGKKFTIRTDHSALTSIFRKKTLLIGRLARWAIALQEYDYIIEH
jgi:hypothetical protein